MSRLIDAELIEKEEGWLDGTCLVIPKQIIYDAPTIDAEPVRHGHWIKMQFNNANFQCTCSVCGGEAIHPQFQWYKENIYPYCPSCGAKMEDN